MIITSMIWSEHLRFSHTCIKYWPIFHRKSTKCCNKRFNILSFSYNCIKYWLIFRLFNRYTLYLAWQQSDQ